MAVFCNFNSEKYTQGKKIFFTENYAQMCNCFCKIQNFCYSIFGEISILIRATNTNFGYTWLRLGSEQLPIRSSTRPVGPGEGELARIGWPANESGRSGVLEYSIVMEAQPQREVSMLGQAGQPIGAAGSGAALRWEGSDRLASQ